MYPLEGLPRADSKSRLARDPHRGPGGAIEVSCSGELLHGVERLSEWTDAFQSLYSLRTGDETPGRHYQLPRKLGIVCRDVEFSVDFSHKLLRFLPRTPAAQAICDEFITYVRRQEP